MRAPYLRLGAGTSRMCLTLIAFVELCTEDSATGRRMSSGVMCHSFGSLGHLKTNSRPSSTCTLMTLLKVPRSEQETPTSSPQCTNAWPHSRETPSSRHPVVGSSRSASTNNTCGRTVSSTRPSRDQLNFVTLTRAYSQRARPERRPWVRSWKRLGGRAFPRERALRLYYSVRMDGKPQRRVEQDNRVADVQQDGAEDPHDSRWGCPSRDRRGLDALGCDGQPFFSHSCLSVVERHSARRRHNAASNNDLEGLL